MLELLSISAQGKLGEYVQRQGGMDVLSWDGVRDEIELALDGVPRSIEEEGLRLPPTRLAAAEGVCQDVIDLFMSRCRMPEQRSLDLTGQLAANRVGLARLAELFDKYGAGMLSEAMDDLLDATERRTRSAIAQVPSPELSTMVTPPPSAPDGAVSNCSDMR